jgi:hypothetical protein
MRKEFKEYVHVETPAIEKWGRFGMLDGLEGWPIHNVAEALEYTANLLLSEESGLLFYSLNKDEENTFQMYIFPVIRRLIGVIGGEVSINSTHEFSKHIITEFYLVAPEIHRIGEDIHAWGGRDLQAEAVSKFCDEFKLF